jgi:hypothetical protein
VWGEGETHQQSWGENPTETTAWEDPGADGTKTLKLIVNKQSDRTWARFM